MCGISSVDVKHSSTFPDIKRKGNQDKKYMHEIYLRSALLIVYISGCRVGETNTVGSPWNSSYFWGCLWVIDVEAHAARWSLCCTLHIASLFCEIIIYKPTQWQPNPTEPNPTQPNPTTNLTPTTQPNCYIRIIGWRTQQYETQIHYKLP